MNRNPHTFFMIIHVILVVTITSWKGEADIKLLESSVAELRQVYGSTVLEGQSVLLASHVETRLCFVMCILVLLMLLLMLLFVVSLTCHFGIQVIIVLVVVAAAVAVRTEFKPLASKSGCIFPRSM